jgi:hypothetical protein
MATQPRRRAKLELSSSRKTAIGFLESPGGADALEIGAPHRGGIDQGALSGKLGQLGA